MTDPSPHPGQAFRVGRKVGRTIYQQDGQEPSDLLVGTMDTPELAALAVAAMNARSALLADLDAAREALRRVEQERDEARGCAERAEDELRELRGVATAWRDARADQHGSGMAFHRACVALAAAADTYEAQEGTDGHLAP